MPLRVTIRDFSQAADIKMLSNDTIMLLNKVSP